MVDELEEVEDSREIPPGDGDLPDPGEMETLERVTELEALLAGKDEELADTSARLAELEQAVAGKDSQIADLNQTRQEIEERLSALSVSLAGAIAGYKELVVRTNPEVVGELVGGDTIEAIDESLGRAKELVSKVRQGVESEISLARVPAGAPERTSPDLSTLSPREKIQYAIGKTQ